MCIRLIAAGGLRVAEAIDIDVVDCVLDASVPHVMVPTFKREGHPKRRVDLPISFASDFRKFLGKRRTGKVFDFTKRTIQNWWRKLQKLARCRIHRGIHSLRHTHLTRLAEMGADPRYSQQRAGWTSLEMYKVYAHVTDSMRKKMASKLPEA